MIRSPGDVRVGPDAMTPNEAVADHQSRVAALQDASAAAEAQAQAPEAFRQSRQALTDIIRQHYDRETVGQLLPDQRAKAAELAGHAFAVEAGKQGLEPLEVYQRAETPVPGSAGEIAASGESIFQTNSENAGKGEVFELPHRSEQKTSSSRFDPLIAEGVDDSSIDKCDEPGGVSRSCSALPESYIKPGVGIDMRSAPSGSDMNAAGHPRNAAWFWRQLAKQHPEYFDLENETLIKKGRAPKINQTWTAEFPSHGGFRGKRLIHHHIDQGPIATPIPEPVHQIWHKVLHPHK